MQVKKGLDRHPKITAYFEAPDDGGEPDDYQYGGGGGAGHMPGTRAYTDPDASSSVAENGTLEHGGLGSLGNGNAGGDLGEAGQGSSTYPNMAYSYGPGGPGAAVKGDGYITWVALGDIHGVRQT